MNPPEPEFESTEDAIQRIGNEMLRKIDAEVELKLKEMERDDKRLGRIASLSTAILLVAIGVTAFAADFSAWTRLALGIAMILVALGGYKFHLDFASDARKLRAEIEEHRAKARAMRSWEGAG